MIRTLLLVFAVVTSACASAKPNENDMQSNTNLNTTQIGVSMASNVNSAAKNSEYKGIAEVRFLKKLTKQDIARAEIKAQQLALEGWISERHPSHLKNYLAVKNEIDENIEQYVLSKTVIDTVESSQKGTYRVVLRAKLNEKKILNELLRETGNKAGESCISFVFVAREAKTTSSDDTKWQVSTTTNIDVAVSSVLADAQYAVIEAGLLEEETDYQLDLNNFIRDYEHGDDLTPATKNAAIIGLKNLHDPIQYLAIGTLDVDNTTVDSVTGNTMVSVSVTAKVLSVHRRGSTVAAVGPVQYVGMGSTPTMAKNNALILAAKEMATTLVAQLSVKTIR